MRLLLGRDHTMTDFQPQRCCNRSYEMENEPAQSHASKVLYPAIKAAMAELGELPEAFNFTVNRALNILYDAYWSETPAISDAAPRRTNLG
jgi:hypothetical protein